MWFAHCTTTSIEYRHLQWTVLYSFYLLVHLSCLFSFPYGQAEGLFETRDSIFWLPVLFDTSSVLGCLRSSVTVWETGLLTLTSQVWWKNSATYNPLWSHNLKCWHICSNHWTEPGVLPAVSLSDMRVYKPSLQTLCKRQRISFKLFLWN